MKRKLSATQKQLLYYIDRQSGLAPKEIASKYNTTADNIRQILKRFYTQNPSLRIQKKRYRGKKINIDIQRDYIPD